MTMQNVRIPTYTKGEEIFNSVSHGVGIPLGITACILCCLKATSTYGIMSSLIFGISMIILYSSSTIYHALKVSDAKKVMRLVDHSVVFVLISGTIGAVSIAAIYPYNKAFALGISLTAIGLSILGIVLTFIDQEKFKAFQMFLYLAIGWMAIAMFFPIQKYCENANQIMWLVLAGGITYTVGAILYGVGKSKKYFHSIFHLFVLAGTICHFCAVYICLF